MLGFFSWLFKHSSNKPAERCNQNVVCDTAKFDIDPIQSKYKASIADANTDTLHLEKQLIYFQVG